MENFNLDVSYKKIMMFRCFAVLRQCPFVLIEYLGVCIMSVCRNQHRNPTVDNGEYPKHHCARKSFCSPGDRRSDPWKRADIPTKFRNRLRARYTEKDGRRTRCWEKSRDGFDCG